jgi:hypothetical protein
MTIEVLVSGQPKVLEADRGLPSGVGRCPSGAETARKAGGKMMLKTIIGTCLFVLMAITIAEAAATKQCRSSITGKMVSMKYAKAHPDTTQCAERK